MHRTPPATPDPARPPSAAPERSLTTGTLVAAALLVILAAAAFYWANILLLFFAAILIAIALRAGAHGLHRLTRLPVKIGVVVVLLLVILALVGAGFLAGPAISEQFRELIDSLPEAWEGLNDWLSSTVPGEAIQSQLENAPDLEEGAGQMAERLPDIFGTIAGIVNAVVGSLFSIFLMLIVALYVAVEAGTYRRGTLALVPPRHRGRAAEVMDELTVKLGKWMGGQAMDMLAVAIMAGIGLWALGVPLAFLLAVIAGLTNIVPIVGPFVSGAIAVLFAFSQGFELAWQVALLFVVIQLIDGEIILPLIQRYAVRLPPALTVLAIMAMSSLFGFIGVLLATPLLVVLIVLIRRIYVEDVLGDRADAEDDP